MESLTFRFPSVPRIYGQQEWFIVCLKGSPLYERGKFFSSLATFPAFNIPTITSYQIFLLAGRSKNEACSFLLPFGQRSLFNIPRQVINENYRLRIALLAREDCRRSIYGSWRCYSLRLPYVSDLHCFIKKRNNYVFYLLATFRCLTFSD